VNMPLAKWIEILKEIVSDRPSVDQRKLFHDNASNFYRLG
jgi:predicted TIM-barrel fold metal-dependent hydrolase